MGQRVGAIAITPGSVRLDKSKNDLSVTCSKDGYQTATTASSPSFNGATFGNIIAGGVVGVIVDAASGANYSYASDIRMDMAPNPVPSVMPMVSGLAPADQGIRLNPTRGQAEQPSAFLIPVSATNGVGAAGSYPR